MAEKADVAYDDDSDRGKTGVVHDENSDRAVVVRSCITIWSSHRLKTSRNLKMNPRLRSKEADSSMTSNVHDVLSAKWTRKSFHSAPGSTS